MPPPAEIAPIRPLQARVPREEQRSVQRQWAPVVLHQQFLAVRELVCHGFERRLGTAARESHCYNCRFRVSEREDALCTGCSMYRIICPNCGACGCGYKRGQYANAWEEWSKTEWRHDDVLHWIVQQGDAIVFPLVLNGKRPLRSKRTVEYERFMRSAEWKGIRDEALKRAAFRCAKCGSDRWFLQVHHLTYDRFGGDERDEDLQVLCEPCHYVTHHYAEHFAMWEVKNGAAISG